MKLLLFFLAVIIAGCVNPFAPAMETSGSGSESILGDPRTIDGILQNFKQAYTFKDTAMYGRLLSSDFLFVYRDYEKGADVFWGRDDELRSTSGLFQNAQRLDLIWNNTIGLNGDSLKISLTRNFNLTVTFSPNDVVRIDGYANLTMTRSAAGEVWRIVRWRDESNF